MTNGRQTQLQGTSVAPGTYRQPVAFHPRAAGRSSCTFPDMRESRRPRPGEARMPGEEAARLQEAAQRKQPWKLWGPYLSERQWGTVREDYSPGGSCWDYFPHDQARS